MVAKRLHLVVFSPRKEKVRCGAGKLQVTLSWFDWFASEKSLEVSRSAQDGWDDGKWSCVGINAKKYTCKGTKELRWAFSRSKSQHGTKT